MEETANIIRVTLRLPQDAAAFLDGAAERNVTSRNAEIVRSIRERMAAATGEGLANTAPAAAQRTDALPGVNSING